MEFVGQIVNVIAVCKDSYNTKYYVFIIAGMDGIRYYYKGSGKTKITQSLLGYFKYSGSPMLLFKVTTYEKVTIKDYNISRFTVEEYKG